MLDALANLHHPIRAVHWECYLHPSQELPEEIQVIVDIFFPKH